MGSAGWAEGWDKLNSKSSRRFRVRRHLPGGAGHGMGLWQMLRFPNRGPWMGRKGRHLMTEGEEKGTSGWMVRPGFEAVGLDS